MVREAGSEVLKRDPGLWEPRARNQKSQLREVSVPPRNDGCTQRSEQDLRMTVLWFLWVLFPEAWALNSTLFSPDLCFSSYLFLEAGREGCCSLSGQGTGRDVEVLLRLRSTFDSPWELDLLVSAPQKWSFCC